MTLQDILPILSALLGTGGILTALLTLRATRKSAEEDAETKEIANADNLVNLYARHLVTPLTAEMESLRKEVALLRAAIRAVNTCANSDSCPVRHVLQNHDEDHPSDVI